MAPMTASERQRKYREKLKRENPEKLQKLKKENAERTKRKYRKIKELPENLQNLRRLNWRQQKQKKKDEPKITPIIEKKKRKIRYLLSKKNLILNAKLKKLTTIIRSQRKALYRYRTKMSYLQLSLEKLEKENEDLRNLNKNINIESKEAITPGSKTERFLHETFLNIPTPEKEKVKKVILEGNVLKESISNEYSKAKSNSERVVLKNLLSNDIVKKYKLKTEFASSCLRLKGRLRQRQVRALQTIKMRRMKEIQHFLEREDNSRITAGKRETKTLKKEKCQVRYLLESLEKLHKKYKEEGGLASYTTFTRYRPFYILDPKIQQRNTCACVKHANLSFLAKKLKLIGVLQTDDLDELVSAIVCDKLNDKCMYNECKICEKKIISIDLSQKNKDLIVSWNAWVTKTHEYMKSNNNQENEKKITKRTVKDVIHGTLETLVQSFSDQLLKFKKHFFNVYHAFKMYKKCKETLSLTECIIHCDFSENYLCKCNEEVQATHFGASQQQFTLHTGVLYYKNEQGLQDKSFCTISPNNNHGPIAIWSHLSPILEYITKSLPKVATINFFSDGPTTQYRQKGNFYLMSEMTKKLGFQKSTWSFFESAHGKGAADGIGGAVKRILDKKVAYGEDIVNARTAYEILGKCQSKIMFFYISNENIKTVEQEVDLTGLIPVPHTMGIHQIITTGHKDIIKFRKLACFCREREETFCECFELQEHNLKLKKQKRKCVDKKIENTNKTSKRRRIIKSQKRSSKADDSDTTIDSDITFADSDDSNWDVNDEYDFENKYENNENVNLNKIDVELKDNNAVINETENLNANHNKKVTLLSDIRNTPQNYRYFNLENYGPLTLHKVNKIELCMPTTSGVKQKHKKILLEEENSLMMENDSNEKRENEPVCDNSIKSGLEEKCKNDAMKSSTEIELRDDVMKEDALEGKNIIIEEKEVETEIENNNYSRRENESEKITNAQEEIATFTYNNNDSVLVRYFQKKSWVYYVGFIEDVEIKTHPALL